MVTIVGNGGHGRMLQELLRLEGITAVCVDAEAAVSGPVMIGLGNLVTVGDAGLERRAALFEKYRGRVSGFRHGSGIVHGYVAESAQILARVVVNTFASVGHNAILNTGCIVEHDCVIGDHVHVAPGAVLCGKVYVGEMTHIGAGSVVRQGVHIGRGVVIAMGSVVVKDVPDGRTWLKGEII